MAARPAPSCASHPRRLMTITSTATPTASPGAAPTATPSLAERYRRLDRELPRRAPDEVVDPSILLAFDYPEDGARQNVRIETDEFTAVCPWTGLPDNGR